MSQRELTDFLGFDQSYVSRVERGQRKIRDVQHLRHMAVRLGIPVEELAVAAGMLGPPGKDQSSRLDQDAAEPQALAGRMVRRSQHGRGDCRQAAR
jgi:transcriptional regulator with XRE-family HTH domain